MLFWVNYMLLLWCSVWLVLIVEHQGRYLEECFNQTDLISHWLP